MLRSTRRSCCRTSSATETLRPRAAGDHSANFSDCPRTKILKVHFFDVSIRTLYLCVDRQFLTRLVASVAAASTSHRRVIRAQFFREIQLFLVNQFVMPACRHQGCTAQPELPLSPTPQTTKQNKTTTKQPRKHPDEIVCSQAPPPKYLAARGPLAI